MQRIWIFLGLWALALPVIGLLMMLDPAGSQSRNPVIVGLLLVLQLSALAIVMYSAVRAWRSRRSARERMLYAVPPVAVLLGFFVLLQLMALANAAH